MEQHFWKCSVCTQKCTQALNHPALKAGITFSWICARKSFLGHTLCSCSRINVAFKEVPAFFWAGNTFIAHIYLLRQVLQTQSQAPGLLQFTQFQFSSGALTCVTLRAVMAAFVTGKSFLAGARRPLNHFCKSHQTSWKYLLWSLINFWVLSLNPQFEQQEKRTSLFYGLYYQKCS